MRNENLTTEEVQTLLAENPDRPRVLTACAFSGTIRDAFARTGALAVSCDFLETEAPGYHHVGDVLPLLDMGWDLMTGGPPCTYLANSGVRWLHEQEGRWGKLFEGVRFFRRLWEAPVPRIVLENPVPHRYAREMIGDPYAQTVQPWQFGVPETKRTCLWLKNLPELEPTEIMEERKPRVHMTPPGPDRWKARSRFPAGIADAMADQWGPILRKEYENNE